MRCPERCLCGAPDCPECGRAQGFSQCPYCGQWACDNPECIEAGERGDDPEGPPDYDMDDDSDDDPPDDIMNDD
ncbi:MAG: hypothetical protein WC551_08890 [Patescibacteria group bacterium]